MDIPLLFNVLTPSLVQREPRHFQGLPPVLTNSVDTRIPLPPGRILLISRTSSGIFLYRYTANGGYAGDTWHANVDDALEQASFEFEEDLNEWQDVPEGVVDALVFVQARMQYG